MIIEEKRSSWGRNIVLLSCVVLVSVVGALWYSYYARATQQPAVDFVLEEAMTTAQVAEKLRAEGRIRSTFLFSNYVRYRDWDEGLQVGNHALEGKLSPYAIALALRTGSHLANERVVTLIEGWTVDEIGQKLEDSGVVTKQAFLDAIQNSRDAFAELVPGLPATAALEGIYFPDTYRFFTDGSADDVVTKLIATYEAKVLPLFQENKSAMTPLEILTLASILEKEVRTTEERKIAAGVFLNRLAIGQALESDATVNYVTKKGTDRPSYDDIAIDSPYNTYKYRGLPPGPINNPGLATIEAVLNPTASSYYYFVTDADGVAHFAETFAGHKANIVKWLE